MTSWLGGAYNFLRAEHGGVAALFAVALPVLMLATGLAIDQANAYRIQANLQADADTAVLTAASAIGVSDAEAVERARLFFNSALQRRGLTSARARLSLTYNKQTNVFVADVTYSSSTYFAALAGLEDLEVEVHSSAAPEAGTRVLDIAMCIDATGSMQSVLDAVTANALSMFSNLNARFAAANIPEFDVVRARPIFFRDFGGNWQWYDVATGGQVDKYPNGLVNRAAGDARNYGDDVPMRAAADFYNLVDQSSDLHSFVNGEIESGGGDYTESGLECLNEAMNSNWTKPGQSVKTAQGTKAATDIFSVIAIWTDQNAHPPAFSYSLLNPNYPPPTAMPRDYAGLAAKWADDALIPQSNKLLAMFIPNAAPTSGWDPVMSWDRFMIAGSLTDGTDDMVDRLAEAVKSVMGKSGKVRLTN